MADPTPAQLRVLRHMLGIDTPFARVPQPYRNHYAAPPEDPELAEMARLGVVEKISGPRPGYPYDHYVATAAGRSAALKSFKTIQKSPAARRYAKFLDVRERHPDLTFREFLISPEYDHSRRSA